jgi:hypothetical protein
VRTPILLAVLLLLPIGGRDFATLYEVGRVIRVERTLTLDVEQTMSDAEKNGKPVKDFTPTTVRTLSSRRDVHVDRVVEATDGRATRVERRYETLEGESGTTFDDKSTTNALWTPFVGVVLDIHAGQRASIVAPAEKLESLDKLLDGHRADLALDALLPRGPVEGTATWAIDAGALMRALGLDIDPVLFPSVRLDGKHTGEKSREETHENRRSPLFTVLAKGAWKGKALLVAADREHGGVHSGAISIDVSLSDEVPFEPDIPAMTPEQRKTASVPSAVHAKCTAHLTGELLVSLSERRPVSLALEGPVQVDWKIDFAKNPFASRASRVDKGTLKLVVALNGANPVAVAPK